jgi:hypothetical protein
MEPVVLKKGPLQEEYSLIAQGMRADTLKGPPPEKHPALWVSKRFSSTFEERYSSRQRSSEAYSFGLCTLEASKKVSVSRDMNTTGSAETISPGPFGYTLKGSFGSGSAQHIESTARRGYCTHFGTDLRHCDGMMTQDVREAKARDLPVDAELQQLREHSTAASFGSLRAAHS